MLLKSLIFPFLVAGILLLLVAVYLPKNRSFRKMVKEQEENLTDNSLLKSAAWIMFFGVVLAGAFWWLSDDDIVGKLLSIAALTIMSFVAILMVAIELAFRIFSKGVPVAMEAGRHMTPEQRQKVSDFAMKHGKKIIDDIFPS